LSTPANSNKGKISPPCRRNIDEGYTLRLCRPR
jgi:hypothetical protein